jgi:hypothetical protein
MWCGCPHCEFWIGMVIFCVCGQVALMRRYQPEAYQTV